MKIVTAFIVGFVAALSIGAIAHSGDDINWRGMRYDYGFKGAVRSVIEDCSVDDEDISC